MTLLAAKDKGFITDNVRELILSSGLIGARYTPDPAVESLYGLDDIPYAAGESFPLELQSHPAETLTKMRADAVINILPEQELNTEDRVEISSVMYKMLSVEKQNCFGTISHKTIRLVRHHGS